MGDNQLSSWDKQVDQLAQSISGAFIFGITLLYTVEVWQIGIRVEFWKLFLFLIFALVLSMFMGYYADLSKQKGIKAIFFKSVESFAIGVVAATTGLFLLNRLNLADPPDVIISKIVIMVIPFSVGAFLAEAIIPSLTGRKKEEDIQEENEHPIRAALDDIAVTIAGGIFIGFPIAPSAEISKLAAEMTFWHELALVIFSLIISYIIVFASSPMAEQHIKKLPFLERPIVETVLSYVVSLVLAFIMLIFFDQIKIDDPLRWIVSQVILLALPLTIGGAAGRLAV